MGGFVFITQGLARSQPLGNDKANFAFDYHVKLV
jgi:hypothetical protein